MHHRQAAYPDFGWGAGGGGGGGGAAKLPHTIFIEGAP